jgi:hypothetical protein
MRVKAGLLNISIVGICVCFSALSFATPPTWTISGVVATANGTGVEGVNVVGNNSGGSAVTGADGSYAVTVPNHWDGTITVSKAGWLITPPTKTYTNVSADIANQNYTAYQPKISGLVTKSDGTPLAGAAVTADNGGGTDTTDASGYYEFYVPYNWSGMVSATLAGYHFTEKNYTNLTADQTNQVFPGYQPTISGYVRNAAGTGLSGATVSANNGGGSTTSAANGYYEVVVPYNWSGAVTATLAGYSFTAKNYTNVITDQTNQNFSGFQPTISGYVRKSDGTGLSDATVTVNNGGGSTATNASGYYQITVAYNWSGAVSASLSGYSFTAKNYANVRTDQTNQNFSGFQPTISGSTGVAGATVTVSDVGSVISTPAYSVTVPYGWSGTIEAGLAGYHFPESPRSYTNVTANQTNQNFTGQPTYSGGDGSAVNPYQIGTVAEFIQLSETSAHWSKCFILTVDIDLAGQTFTQAPIAPNTSTSSGFQGTPFTGVFDGDGHVISNLTIAASTKRYIGLVGRVGNSGQIKNLGIVNANIHGIYFVGGLAGDNNYGTITSCYATSAVNGTQYIGGLVGDNYHGTITSCYATGAVNGSYQVGGLAGINSGVITSCYATGAVDGSPSSSTDVGGLAGYISSGVIASCYATGATNGSSYVGGLIGRNYCGKVIHSYSTGKPTGTSSVGGLCGYKTTGGNYADTNNFWDKESSGITTSAMGTGKTTIQMKTLSTFTGWDFDGTWAICEGGTYPYLRWEGCTPCMDISNHTLTFEATSKSINPDSQTFTIVGSCEGVLNWSIDKPAGCDWLAVSPLSNNYDPNITEVTVSIDISSLDYGTYNCDLTVSAPNVNNSPQVVTVMLDVLGPEIGVAPSSINFECDVDEPNVLSQGVAISNSGYDMLNWQISEDCPWLSVSPVSGQCVSGPNEVTLTADTAGLDIGFYNCTLTITDENASNSPVTIPVSLHVYRSGERHVPTEYPTLQQAIDAAVNGDHVIVHPGWYDGLSWQYSSISFKGKAITVRSIDPTNPEIAASTILDGYWISFDKGEGRDSVLDGLTLNGSVNCYNSSPVIRNCVLLTPYPSTYYGSGSLIVYNSNPYIQNCTFTGMKSKRDQRGTSLYVSNNRNTAGDTIIENCLFNLKYDNGYQVTAIQILQGHADIINSTIAYGLPNIDDSYPYLTLGAGVFIRESDVSVKNSIVWGNRGSDDTQIVIQNHSSAFDDPLNSRVDIAYSDIEGGQNKILMFPNYAAFDNYYQNVILPDPNLIDPNTLTYGPGNMDVDPLFVREPNDGGDGWFPIYTNTPPTGYDYTPLYNNDYGDLHLKSQAGRFVWDGFARADFNLDKRVDLIDFATIAQNWGLSIAGVPYGIYWNACDLDGNLNIGLGDLMLFCEDYLQPRTFGAWAADEVTSPCIDAGDPNDAGWQNELWPHGSRINMGAYGGTPQASMSPNPVGNTADLNHDNAVDMIDWSLWADDWGDERVLMDSDFDRDNDVDPNDMDIFMNNWLWGK